MHAGHTTTGQRLIVTVVLVVSGAVVSVAAGILAGLIMPGWPPIVSRPLQALVILIVAVLYGFAGSRLVVRGTISRISHRHD